ncbi:MAG: right-handed parallel beta-helix repeat-containing protein, partial [Thermoplasmatota archaeon]
MKYRMFTMVLAMMMLIYGPMMVAGDGFDQGIDVGNTDQSIDRLGKYPSEGVTLQEGQDAMVEEYVGHSPIRIDNNANLSSQGWPGAGSKADPYVIEGYDIDGSGYGYCIYIGNTTDHLVIKDCYLHDASGNNGYYFKNSGLHFWNVLNATAVNITVSENGYGIYSDWSDGNLFLENNLSGNNFGAEFHRSESNELKNNNISDNDYG